MTRVSPPTIRPVSVTEFPEFIRSFTEVFGVDIRDADRDMELAVFEPERSLAVFDGDTVVGTAGAYSRRMTLPGRILPIAAVSLVSVSPTHRRRGLLTAMMRHQLTELFEAEREPVAALWASEASIYGRFGYGLASRHTVLTGRTQRMTLRPDLDRGAGRMRQPTVAELSLLAAGLRDRLAERSVGWLDRPGSWWQVRGYDPEHRRGGTSTLRAVVYEQLDGELAGYALYQIVNDWSASEPNHEVRVREVVAATPSAYAAVWGFLLNLDLVRRVRAEPRPLDEPLQHMVDDARAVELALYDNLWLRVVDVGRALSSRCYGREVDVVFDVADPFCPWNTGRWRLAGGPHGAECVRTSAVADLSLTSAELGAALLGGTSLAVLAAAGRVDESRPGALAAASAAFVGDRQPWCPEVF